MTDPSQQEEATPDAFVEGFSMPSHGGQLGASVAYNEGVGATCVRVPRFFAPAPEAQRLTREHLQRRSNRRVDIRARPDRHARFGRSADDGRRLQRCGSDCLGSCDLGGDSGGYGVDGRDDGRWID